MKNIIGKIILSETGRDIGRVDNKLYSIRYRIIIDQLSNSSHFIPKLIRVRKPCHRDYLVNRLPKNTPIILNFTKEPENDFFYVNDAPKEYEYVQIEKLLV